MGGGAESRAAGSCGPDSVDHGHSVAACGAWRSACNAACPYHAAACSACSASTPCTVAVITGARHLVAWLSAAFNSCPTVALAPRTSRQRPSEACVVVHLQGGLLQADFQGLVLAIIILMNQPLPPIHHPPSPHPIHPPPAPIYFYIFLT